MLLTTVSINALAGCPLSKQLCQYVCLTLRMLLQVDPSIYRQYCAAFCGLYYSCKKNNKVRKASAPCCRHFRISAAACIQPIDSFYKQLVVLAGHYPADASCSTPACTIGT